MSLKSGNVTGGKNLRRGQCQKSREEKFTFKKSLKQDSLSAKIRDGKMFGYVECYLELPEGLE